MTTCFLKHSDIVIKGLFEWLHIADVCSLDSAICSKAHRAVFLAGFADVVGEWHHDAWTKVDCAAYSRWLRARRVKPVRVHLSHGDDMEGDLAITEAVVTDVLRFVDSTVHVITLADGHLKSFSVACPSIGNANEMIFKALSHTSKGLEELQLDGRYGDSELFQDGINEFTEWNTSLRIVKLLHIQMNEDSVLALLQRCRCLVQLDLEECVFVPSDNPYDAPPALGHCISEVANECEPMEELNVRSCLSMSESCLESMLRSRACRTVLLLMCGGVSDRCLSTLARRSQGTLTYLNLMLAPDITDLGLILVLKNCRNLGQLNIVYCPRISDDALFHLTHLVPSIHTLIISGNEQISNAGVKAVAQKCRGLRKLVLIACERLDDLAVMHVAKHCKNLMKFSVGECHAVSDAAVVALSTFGNTESLYIYDCPRVTRDTMVGYKLCNPRAFVTFGAEEIHLEEIELDGYDSEADRAWAWSYVDSGRFSD
jgi:hypothetical protein